MSSELATVVPGTPGKGSRAQPDTQHGRTRRSEEGPGENGQDSEAFRDTCSLKVEICTPNSPLHTVVRLLVKLSLFEDPKPYTK
jgi:hypothetical protein